MITLPHGWIGLGERAQDFLTYAILDSEGDYLELGTGDGGSAIVAALALKERGSGIAVTVDPFHPKVADKLYKNAIHFGVDDKIAALRATVPPWPGQVLRHRWGVVLLDGPHDEREWFAWRDIRELIDHWLLIDNTEKAYPNKIAEEAIDWGFVLVEEFQYNTERYPDQEPNTFTALRRLDKC